MSEKQELNHHHTQHPMAMQRSNYICVDDSTDKKHVLTLNAKKQMNKNKTEDEI